MKHNFLILLITIFLVSSCIPKKDLVYFQGQPSNKVPQLTNKPYKLQVNDILDIRIKAEDEKIVSLFTQQDPSLSRVGNQFTNESIYFTSYSVDREGNIRMPYLGDINVLGYTEKEVRKKIEDQLKRFFLDTSGVFVTVKLAGIRFTVIGEVKNTGTIVLYQNQVTILEALANAGDIEVTGNRKRVALIRKNTEGTKKFIIDLTSASAFDSESYFIQSNDVIYVEPLKQKSWGTGTTGLQTLTTIVSIVSLVASAVLISRNL